jgi:hypothetical protein
MGMTIVLVTAIFRANSKCPLGGHEHTLCNMGSHAYTHTCKVGLIKVRPFHLHTHPSVQNVCIMSAHPYPVHIRRVCTYGKHSLFMPAKSTRTFIESMFYLPFNSPPA